MNPRQSPTTHTESLGDEASVYDWAHAQVHALNPTTARVWQLCDGETSADAIAAALHRETGVPEADAVVDLTLKELARLHLLELPVDAREDRPAPTRRWLLERGLAAAMLPAVYTILTPSSLEAQSPGGAPTLPTLTTVAPNQGTAGTTVAVTLTGTNFVAGATVTVSGVGVTVNTIVVGGPTSLTANFVIAPGAATGPRTVTVATGAGTSAAQTFTIIASAAPGVPTLASVAPNQGIQGATVAVTLTGTNFIVGATTVNVSGTGVTATPVAGGSTTSLTANFVIDAAAAVGPRDVTVTTAGGTSGAQIFTITAPAPGAPTLTTVSPNQGIQGATVAVTLTGTNFVVGATTVVVADGGVTVNTIAVSSTTSLTANFVIEAVAAAGSRNVTVTTAGGASGAQTFTINPPPPTLTSIAPNQGIRGTTVGVTLTGTNFVAGATVAIGGGDITVNNVVVVNSTMLTASFVLGLIPAAAARTVTVTTAGGTSVAQTFTINLPAAGSATFAFKGVMEPFTVPPGVTTLNVTVRGAQGGAAAIVPPNGFGSGGQGGSVAATLAVVAGETLNVLVGGQGGTSPAALTPAVGGFNGGGAGGQGTFRGGGGGASDIRRGAVLLVVAGGGGGGSFTNGNGGAGGGTTGADGADSFFPPNGPLVTGGNGGTQVGGGAKGTNSLIPANDGQAGISGIGGNGGPGTGAGAAGGGGGGGLFGGGGGAGALVLAGGSGGGGSSFGPAGAVHTQGGRTGNGEIMISW